MKRFTSLIRNATIVTSDHLHDPKMMLTFFFHFGGVVATTNATPRQQQKSYQNV